MLNIDFKKRYLGRKKSIQSISIYVNSPRSMSVDYILFFQIRIVLSGDFSGLACICCTEVFKGNWC